MTEKYLVFLVTRLKRAVKSFPIATHFYNIVLTPK